ncbi:MAG: CNNM domain-containing protein [Treponema sp.]|jgi:putative hemolysin|nr:CNNM domain-containing protein [Treponema sp.]
MDSTNNQDPLLWQLLLQFCLIAVNAIFACAEIALLSVNAVKLERRAAGGSRRARRLLALTKNPARFLAAIQVGITLAGFLGSAFAAENFSRRLRDALTLPAALLARRGIVIPLDLIGTVSLILITVILSFFTLVLGELVPKRIAMHRAEALAFGLSSPITAISRLFAPVVWLLTVSTNALLRLCGIDPEAEKEAVTEEEIRLLIDAGNARGSIAAGEKEIIHNVFEFNDKTAGEVMTHRRDAALLWLKDDDAAWERTIAQKRHSYYPVCGATVDDIRGVLSARDYLGLKNKSRAGVLKAALRPPQLVPNTLGAHALFWKMKARRNHFALVLDEYGSLDGIITLNDLLEELVGDLADQEDHPGFSLIEKKAPGLWRVSGGAGLDRLERETGVSLSREGENYGTFGGLVFTLLGRVPDDGEQCEAYYPAGQDEKPGKRPDDRRPGDEGRPGESRPRLYITATEVKDHRLVSALVRLLPSGDSGCCPPGPSA